jgi:hypothetical protein
MFAMLGFNVGHICPFYVPILPFLEWECLLCAIVFFDFTGAYSQEFALSFRRDFGLELLNSVGTAKIMGNLGARWTEYILPMRWI